MSSFTAIASERLLLLGDSHSAGSFGDGLRNGLFSLGLTQEKDFYQISVSGSSATQWVYGRLQDLKIDSTIKLPGKPKLHRTGALREGYNGVAPVIEKFHPNHVIVALGTNDLFQYYEAFHPGAIQRAREEKAARKREPASISPAIPLDPLPPELAHDPMGRPLFSMRKLLRFDTHASCTLVLPPNLSEEIIPKADQDRFFSRLKEEAIKDHCGVVDSRLIMDHSDKMKTQTWQECQSVAADSHPLVSDRKDGIHFSQIKGEYWGHCVALAIKTLDNH